MAGAISSPSMNLFRQGIGYLESGNFSEALLCFGQVYKTDGYVPNLHYACAVAFMKLGRKRDAALACQSEIAENPDHRDAIALLNGIMAQLELSWPEKTYIVNHEHHFIYCPIPKVLCSNMKKTLLKIAGLHEQHGHGLDGKRWSCKVNEDIHKCAQKECGFNTNMGAALKILNGKIKGVRNEWRLLKQYTM